MASFPLTPPTGRIKISDGAGTPLVLVVPYEQGDVSESGDAQPDGWEVEQVFARGTPVGFVKTKRSGKQLKFSAVATGPGSTDTLEDLYFAKGTYAALTSMAPGGYMVDAGVVLLQVEWQQNIGGVWTTHTKYKYCHLSGNRKDGSPVGSFEMSIQAHACADDWATYTTS